MVGVCTACVAEIKERLFRIEVFMFKFVNVLLRLVEFFCLLIWVEDRLTAISGFPEVGLYTNCFSYATLDPIELLSFAVISCCS